MSIGERISQLRKEQNISQVQLAKALDISRQAVSKWENDQTAPDTIKLIQLADVLNTDVEYLATGNHSRRAASPAVVTVVEQVEKIVERPVEVEKIIEVEKIVETVIEKPVIKKVFRVKYLRNPIEFALVGVICFAVGLALGIFL